MRPSNRRNIEINSSSMADIAFLLLIFFLVTTTIQSNKGLSATLPPDADKPDFAEIHDRNLFKIHINSSDKILIEDAPFRGFDRLHQDLKKFILNNGREHDLSESPQKATVSLQMNRGTHYKRFIEAMDAVQGVYYEIYGEQVGLTAAEFRKLDLKIADQKAKYDRARDGIPMNISVADPYQID